MSSLSMLKRVVVYRLMSLKDRTICESMDEFFEDMYLLKEKLNEKNWVIKLFIIHFFPIDLCILFVIQ